MLGSALRYGNFLSVGGEFVVVSLSVGGVVLYNMSVAGVRVVEFGT